MEPGLNECFCRAKSNIGPDGGGFGYELHQGTVAPGIMASVVHWREPIEGTAREILGEAEAEETDGSARAEAEAFVQEFLSGGQRPVNEIKTAAEAFGHAWATVKRAKKALKITPIKTGMKGGWDWRLREDAQEGPKALSTES